MLMIDRRTAVFMLTGLFGGLAVNLPLLSWLNGGEWEWAQRFPLFALGAGMQAMSVFFHEIGHSLFFWFYGYVAVPTFDMAYGGGMAYAVTGQMTILLAVLYALTGYGLYLFRGDRPLQAALLALLVFNLATALRDVHEAVIDFMGPGTQALVGGFFLYRAWCDLAPRGGVERWLNATIGFGMVFQVLIEGRALLYDSDAREAYDSQKGGHGLGDFNQVADTLLIAFDTVVTAWMGLAVLCLVLPFGLYCLQQRKEKSRPD